MSKSQNTSSPTVLVLCVNYHSEDATKRFVASAQQQQFSGNLQIYVVDNSFPPAPNAFDDLAHIENLTVLSPKENLGYFGGAAYGFDAYTAQHGLPDWVIVSNPDITLDDADFFEKMCTLHQDTHCAMLAPRIMSSLTGDNQNPFMRQRPGKPITLFRKQLARHALLYNSYEILSHLKRGTRGLIKRMKGYVNGEAGDLLPIYAPHGSFLIFNRAYFEAGGNLVYEPFLYGEENYVGEISRQLNLPVIYDPRLKITHQEHATTGLMKSKRIVASIFEARSYLIQQFYVIFLMISLIQ